MKNLKDFKEKLAELSLRYERIVNHQKQAAAYFRRQSARRGETPYGNVETAKSLDDQQNINNSK